MKRGDVVLTVAPGELESRILPWSYKRTNWETKPPLLLSCRMSPDIRRFERVRPVVSPAAMTGVRVPSQIMTDKIVALPRTRIRRVVGRLDPPARQMLDQALLFVLGLAI